MRHTIQHHCVTDSSMGHLASQSLKRLVAVRHTLLVPGACHASVSMGDTRRARRSFMEYCLFPFAAVDNRASLLRLSITFNRICINSPNKHLTKIPTFLCATMLQTKFIEPMQCLPQHYPSTPPSSPEPHTSFVEVNPADCLPRLYGRPQMQSTTEPK